MSEVKKLDEILEYIKTINSPEWIYQRKGLSKYLGGMPEQTIIKMEKAGIIKSYKIGRQRIYKKAEIDQVPIPTN